MPSSNPTDDLWDAERYLRFAGPRRRPAAELLARLPLAGQTRAADLGCGTAELARALADRLPEAVVVGVDSSADMLARAVAHPRVELVRDDVRTWLARADDDALDLVVSNAALHWLDDHEDLLAACLRVLAPGGCLGVQVPRNHPEPSHRLLADLVHDGPWAARLTPLLREYPVAEPGWYLRTLRRLGARTADVWTTTYQQVLSGPDPVFSWVLGSTLRPLLPALTADERPEFSARYAAALADAYPPEPDGTTVFPFTRLFFVATT